MGKWQAARWRLEKDRMAKNYWLIKSEPNAYAWQQLVKDKTTSWDGVRNYQARNHLRAMQKGDLLLYYHSGDEKAVVGIAEVTCTAYPDPTAEGVDFSSVAIKPVKALKRSVTLAEIRQTPSLKNMLLLKQGRLSVSPLTAQEYHDIVELSGS